MHRWLSAVQVGCVVGQWVAQPGIERLGNREHVAQAGVGWCRVWFARALASSGGGGGGRYRLRPCSRTSPDGAGDVGAGSPGVVPPGRFSCVHGASADGLSCPGRACMTHGGASDGRHANLKRQGRAPTVRGWTVSGERRATVEETGNRDTSRRKPVVIAAVVVLAVAVICGGGLWWHNHTVREHDQALTSYQAAVKDYASQKGQYRAYLDSDEVKSATAIKEEEVSDAKTVKAMAKDTKTIKPASSRKTNVKTGLTGDASTGELKEATGNLAAQASRMKAEVRTLKAKVLAVNTSKAHKQLSDAVGNADRTLAGSDGRVPDGDHSRDELAKTLDSAKKTLKDRKSVLKTFTDAKATLDAKVKAVADAVSAKAQADAQAAQQAANAQAAADAQSQSAPASGYAGGGYSGGGYRAPSGGSGGGYAPAGGGNGGGNAGGGPSHPTWTGTTDGSNGTAHWNDDGSLVVTIPVG